jgi:tripartite-type tricarboxylate transporter receptor subunit TctC
MIVTRRRISGALAGASLLAALPRAARAAFPDRPIRVIVPFAAGGNADLVGRILGQRMSERLGQPVVVENRAGAGGSVGAEAVARSAPDGYTLLIGSNGPLTVNPILQPRLGYDPLTAFRPIGMANRVAHVLAIGPAMRDVDSLPAFIAATKARPGQIGVGTPGAGSAAHFTLESFAAASGAATVHVPYRSGGALLPDLMAGNLPAAMVELSSILPPHREGKVRILAVAAAARSPQLPDVPTFSEAGVRDFTAASYVGLLAPTGLPREAEAKLTEAFAAALTDPLLRERMESSGGEVVSGAETTPDGFAAFLREELARARATAAHAGIKPE